MNREDRLRLRLWPALVLMLLAALMVLLLPLEPPRFPSRARPSASYEQALARVAALRAGDGPAIRGECGTLLLTHGARAARAVVLLDGLTNCPEQFRALGESLYVRGANVLVPRLPHHGLADRMTGDLANLRAGEQVAFADSVLDAAAGLGDSVIVVGLSVGAVLAAWAGQERADVARAVVIAPLLGLALAPGIWTPLVTRLTLVLPNRFQWWDPRVRANLPGPQYVYPRYATRALGEIMLTGACVSVEARRTPPAARALVVVTVGGDLAVDNGAAHGLARAWQEHGALVTTYEFPVRYHLNHDIIDPLQVGGNPALVYPVLLRLIAP